MAASAPQPGKAPVLNSWKEIADYLGRGIRTVQRYERSLGLPVRRPKGTPRSSVLAFPAELEQWLLSAPKSETTSTSRKRSSEAASTLHSSLRKTAELCQACDELRTANQEALRKLHTSIDRMQQLIQDGIELRNAAFFAGGGRISRDKQSLSKPN